MDRTIYDYLETMCDGSLEYQIYVLDKIIAKHEQINGLLSDTAKLANEVMLKQDYTKRTELISKLDWNNIDWNKIKIIQSLESPEMVSIWCNAMSKLVGLTQQETA